MIIVWKLEFYREGGSDKHVRDIAGILSVQGRKIDRALIRKTAADLKLLDEWQRAIHLISDF